MRWWRRRPGRPCRRWWYRTPLGYAACYRAGGAGTAAPGLESLFHVSADEAEAHAWVIRGVLEQM